MKTAPWFRLPQIFVFLTLVASAQVSLTTYHYDNQRTGLNPNETILSPLTVTPSTFGRIFTDNVDGFVVGQPLYVPNVNVPGKGIHNVIYVATQHDSVYAFDANAPGSPLWTVSFINPGAGVTTVPISINGCTHVGYTEVGIMGTPVIDLPTSALYVSAKPMEASGSTTTYVHRLHALDITPGEEKFGSPVIIQGSYPPPATNATITFDPLPHNQRPGLLLLN